MNKQLRMGLKVEAEHKGTIRFLKNYHKRHGKFPTNKQVFTKIAKDHLREFKDYYTRLKKVEVKR